MPAVIGELGLGSKRPRARILAPGLIDPLANIPFALRLQTHNGNKTPLGLYQDPACTIPATQEGQSVAARRDELSGGGLVATQSNTMKQPKLHFVDGVPSVVGDGVDDYLDAGNSIPLAGDSTIFISGYSTSLAQQAMVSKSPAGMGDYYLYLDPSMLRPSVDRPFIQGGTPAISGVSGRFVITARISGTTITHRLNGAPNGSSTIPSGLSTTESIMLGAFNGAACFQGGLDSIFISSSALSDADCAKVESYTSTLNP